MCIFCKCLFLIKNIKLGKVDSIFEDTTNNKEAGVDELASASYIHKDIINNVKKLKNI